MTIGSKDSTGHIDMCKVVNLVQPSPMCSPIIKLELSDSGDQSIIVIAINNRDLDIVLSRLLIHIFA